MRALVAIVTAVLVSASPAFAQITSDLDSGAQMSGYGKLATYGGFGIGGLLVMFLGAYMARSAIEEARRGKSHSAFREQILDDEKEKKKNHGLPNDYLGEKVPEWKLEKRRISTAAGLKFLAETDKMFAPKGLLALPTDHFEAIKLAIEDRSVKGIKGFVTARLLEELRSQVRGLREAGHKRIFGRVAVEKLEIVHVEAPAAKVRHTFTALIDAKSKDYLADERTGEVLKGTKKTYEYEEFWQFVRVDDDWLLDRIRLSEEMDTVLLAKNVMTEDDLRVFAKTADEVHLREFIAK